MPLSLSPELERRITEKVESGEYDSAEDVLSDALDALSHLTEEEEAKHNALRREIQKGIDSLNNGRYSPKDEVFARLRARRGRAPA
ncbi:MAG: type II toxin-antitoxin system ParD family antitoxin [Gemmatimonadetes bacterium]|nr:type II toxin-antitoxin system ParD family antitoxin [Gemmatimonadota bacterium]